MQKAELKMELKRHIKEIHSQEDSIEKANTLKILNNKKNVKKNIYQENPKPKREYEKKILGKS